MVDDQNSKGVLMAEKYTHEFSILTPFSFSDAVGWIPAEIDDDSFAFRSIPARYDHNRSRPVTGWRQWGDYFGHAWSAWRFVRLRPARQYAYLTAFPQLAVTIGLIKRLTRSRAKTIAWMFNMGQIYTGVKGRLARFALASVDAIVVHSTAEIDSYSQWLAIPRERFTFVPLSIAKADPSYIEDTNEPFVVAMGSANRDYATLISAVAELGYKTIIIAPPHALPAGTMPASVEIRNGLSLAACHELCQRARVNVVPILDAGAASGQVTMLEAMMFAKAVVVTDCSGTRDYISHGENGMLVPPQNAAAMREAIETLWNDHAQRQAIGQRARAYVLANATFPAAAIKMHSLLKAICAPSI